MQWFDAGETAYMPRSVPHWHFAAADQPTALFSVDMNARPDQMAGGVTDWEHQAVPTLLARAHAFGGRSETHQPADIGQPATGQM